VSAAPASIAALLRESISLHRAGSLEAARAGYARAVALEPTNGDAAGLLALAEFQLGNLDAAAPLAERAARASPANPVNWETLGNVRRARGDSAGAEACLLEALRLAPGSPELYVNLGLVRKDRGDAQAALLCFVQAAMLDRRCAAAHLNVGLALQELGELDEAIAAYRAAIEADPRSFAAHLNLSSALGHAHRFAEALTAARAALALAPDSAVALLNEGSSLAALGEYDDAAASFARALAAAPESLDAWRDLGGSLYRAGRVDEALRAFERGLALRPDHLSTLSTYLLALNYRTEDPGELVAAHRRFDAAAARAPVPRSARRPGRLRVAYVSPDFRRHSVAHFAAAAIERHDRGRIAIHCYYAGLVEDAWTARFRGWADEWVPAARLSDQALAERIAADGIDVLVDLAGHTGGNRLAAFAARPAPVQVTYLGYPTSTGLAAIDYRLSDRFIDPEDGVERGTERLLRLPTGHFCFRPEQAPAVAPPPARACGRITFGSFNVLAKIGAATVRMWSALLAAVPGSRLVLKAQGLHSAQAQARLAERFAARGIDAARLEFAGWAGSLSEHLAWYDRIDIAVDTYPYNGATTTCEALWMGVPVVSLAGPVHASRMGLSILSSAGAADWVAADEAGFVAIGARLAADLPALAAIRAGLRDRLRAAPLLDEAAHAAALDAFFLELAGRG
jgi:predicted O-linked N-acetylglucosamine transferase (SPINDLY family)